MTRNGGRTARGYTSMALGLGLLVGGAYVAGDPVFETPANVAVAAASAVSGSVLTFVVARRLLTSPVAGRRSDGRDG